MTLGSLPTLEAKLKTLFKRKSVPIWVTEYGHETKPQDEFGISYAKQAAYVRRSIAIARGYPFVTMFVWFVYQDDPGQPWDSGLYTQAGDREGDLPAEVREQRRSRSTHATPASRCRQEPRRRSWRSTRGASASSTSLGTTSPSTGASPAAGSSTRECPAPGARHDQRQRMSGFTVVGKRSYLAEVRPPRHPRGTS